MYKDIEDKYKNLIDKAKTYMEKIKNDEHDMAHMNDTVLYTKELLGKIRKDVNCDVCIISAYWYDVGRIEAIENPTELSAKMLKNEMINLGYDDSLINKCYTTIMSQLKDEKPATIEGLIIKDADKLAFLGRGRWREAIGEGKKLDEIVSLLLKIKDQSLYLDEAKDIYEREVVKLIELLYQQNEE